MDGAELSVELAESSVVGVELSVVDGGLLVGKEGLLVGGIVGVSCGWLVSEGEEAREASFFSSISSVI